MASTDTAPKGSADTRLPLFDNAKGLLILLVVFGHAIDGSFWGEAKPTELYGLTRSLYLLIYSFHMPLFIFISGLFAKRERDAFDVDRVVSFVTLGFACKIAIAAATALFTSAPFSFSLLSDKSVPWYMFAMAAMYALAYLLRHRSTWTVLAFSLLLALAAGYDKSIGDFLYLSRIIVFFPFYWVGFCLSPHDVDRVLKHPGVRVAGAVVVVAFACACLLSPRLYGLRPLFTGRNPYASARGITSHGYLNRAIAYTISAAMSAAVLSIVPRGQAGVLTNLGRRTLQVYFWHRPVLIALAATSIPAIALASLRTALPMAVALALLATAISSIGILRRPLALLLVTRRSDTRDTARHLPKE